VVGLAWVRVEIVGLGFAGVIVRIMTEILVGNTEVVPTSTLSNWFLESYSVKLNPEVPDWRLLKNSLGNAQKHTRIFQLKTAFHLDQFKV